MYLTYKICTSSCVLFILLLEEVMYKLYVFQSENMDMDMEIDMDVYKNIPFIDVDLIQVHRKINLVHELKVTFGRIKFVHTKVWNRMTLKPSTVDSLVGVVKCQISWDRLHPKDWVQFRQPRKAYRPVILGNWTIRNGKFPIKLEDDH